MNMGNMGSTEMRDQQAISDMPAVPVDLSRPKQGQPALWKVRRGAVSQPTGLRQGATFCLALVSYLPASVFSHGESAALSWWP